MKKQNLLLIGLAVILVLILGWALVSKTLATTNKAAFNTIDSVYERDILPDILALNNNGKLAPPKTFKTGHVTTTTLTNYIHKTDNGYYIQLPTQTLVPTPAVVDGNLYLSGGFGSKQYYSFRSATGDLNWAINLDDDGPSSPAVEDGTIVFNTESCTIFGCDLITGKQKWSYYLGDPLMSMPTIANGIVYTSYPAQYQSMSFNRKTNSLKSKEIRPTHVLIAIELKSGTILWQKWIDSDIMSAPVAKEDLLYVTTFSGALYKLKQQTGEFIEAKAIRATSVPVFTEDDEVIISKRSDSQTDTVAYESLTFSKQTKQRSVYKKKAEYLDRKVQSKSKLKNFATTMDAGNGFAGGAPVSANWEAAHENIGYSNVSSLQSFQGSRGLYKDGNLYSTMGNEIICTDANGKVKWNRPLDGDLKTEGGFMGTPPIYANGHIIVATYAGKILVLNEEGKLINNYEIENSIRNQPVVDNGWIFVTTDNGRLYAINTGNKAITGWNMWGANAGRTNIN